MALKLRRVGLGMAQDDVAAASGDAFSQRLVSDLEVGKVYLGDISITRASALARALQWTLSEMQAATGIDLGIAESVAIPGVSDPTPIYSLRQLGNPNAQPDGVNITPNPGPHPRDWMQTFMDGDDMDPRIRDGESIYFDTDKTTPDRGVYVIRYRDRAYVRRYSQLPTGPAWTADNPAFAHQFIPDGPDVTVLGKVYRVVGIRDGKALN
ncbi:LexA family transcriptional regulator [Deinococcus soli (ex Cha et al. 2016)]|uniref:LexA family transcriptional regulator n=1 Tax=Deinococcus soli (ex Cha et al. 2016) TaxID=1309411 RepID=UPI00166C1069|nr:LexA family transcriptional regulator [Deinococcus soli (ex Cha et al. 2016)]GGB71639.1 hypothetical protein GCM10008019_29730 [Deinococcus soli (ex Cha et al. 2016)]